MEDQNSFKPETGTPHTPVGQGDLYAQITAEDEEVITVAPKKPPHVVSVAAVLMKITFHIDEFRRSNERMFIFLKTIWSFFLGGLYTCGIITFIITFFSFSQLPIYLETFFKDRGILYDSLDITDYSFSKINIVNLKDSENNFHIPNLIVHSTFTDFLQNRIRVVEANDLKLNLKATEKDIFSEINSLTKLLQIFSSPQKSGLNLMVNLVKINNATLNIQGKNHNIPILFNLSGTYKENNQVIIPFSINEPFLKLDADIKIDGANDARTITLDTSHYGELTLSNRPTEKLKLTVNLQTQEDIITEAKIEMLLSNSNFLKIIRANLKRNAENTFDGSLLFSSGTSYNETSISETASDLTLSFQNLTMTPEGLIITEKPIQLNLRQLSYNSILINGLETTFNGRLSCSIFEGSCNYRLKEKANINLQGLFFNISNYPLQFSQGVSFSVQPTSKKTLTLQIADPYFQLEAPLTNIQMNGYIDNQSENLLFNAESTDFILVLGKNQSDNHFQLSIKNGNYLTSDLSMNQINAFIEDYFNPTAQMQFSSESVQTSSSLLLKPISLELTNLDKQTKIKAKVIDTPIVVEAQGSFNPFKYFFSGLFIIPEINLEEIPLKLSEISSIFPSELDQLSGQLMAYGKMTFNGTANITGPLYIGLKNVDFTWKNLPVFGTNGVIQFKSLNPLVSFPNQKIFIQKLKSFAPVLNLFMQFQINNQSLRLSNVSGEIAGQEVMITTSVIPLKNPNETLSLRTAGAFDLEQLNPYFNIPGIYMQSGKGTLNLPFHISNQGINAKNLTFKITDGSWRKDNLENDELNLFTNNSTGYTVRSGQLVLEENNKVNIALDGWLLPFNQKKSYGPENVTLPEDIFKESASKNIPQEIQTLQNKLFEIGSIE